MHRKPAFSLSYVHEPTLRVAYPVDFEIPAVMQAVLDQFGDGDTQERELRKRLDALKGFVDEARRAKAATRSAA